MILPVLPVGTPGPIPTRLHQIWVGSKPPAWVRRCWQTWDEFLSEHHPEMATIRWTNALVEGSPLEVCLQAGRSYGLTPRCIADLIRVQVVANFGGMYFDSDTIPLRPLTDYVGDRQPWIGSAPRTRDSSTLANASYGFPPGHSFLSEVWEQAGDALRRGVVSDHSVAGPRVWRRVARNYPTIDIDYSFENEISDSRIQRTIGTAGAFDLDELRQRYPDTAVLHVVFSAARYSR